jgi:hypothetical protein
LIALCQQRHLLFIPKGRQITYVELVPLNKVIKPMPIVKIANDTQISTLYEPVRETKMPLLADATAEEREYGSILLNVNTVIRLLYSGVTYSTPEPVADAPRT